MKNLKTSWIAGASLAFVLAAAPAAHAVPMTFFGEDLNPGGTVPAGGNAETARNTFLGNLSGGVGTEDFESFSNGDAPPLNLTFPGSTGNIMASLTGGGGILTNGGAGRFPTSGSNLFNVEPGGGAFTIDFSSPIAAFGFYGTDIGDFGGNITLQVSNGQLVNLVVPNTVNAPNGSLLFFGFVDVTSTYTKIIFGNTSGADGFGFDDMTIGDLQQVVTASAPGTLILMGIGLAGFTFNRRRD